MEEKKLYLAWQDPTNRSWHPVGILTSSQDGTFRFVYTEGARSSKNFVPFSGMEDLSSVYESEELFPLFSNRLLSDSRPEYGKVLKWLGIGGVGDKNILFDMLAMTEGIRATDTFEVFKCPAKNPRGQYEVDFYSHGLQHVAKRAIERANSLIKGERLFLACDMQNKYDSMAMALRTDDPVEFIGYCPRYLGPDFRQLLEKNKPLDVVVTVERVNAEAPLNLRLLCKLVAPWPDDGFQPCSDDRFKPLAEYSFQAEPVSKIETPARAAGVLRGSPVGDLVDVNQGDASSITLDKSSGMVDCLPTGRVFRSIEKPMNNSHYGSRKEQKVARQLRGHGAKVTVSPASRGVADLKATFPSGKSWNVQVKPSRSGTPASPSAKDLGRLKISASRSGATPVVAKVKQNGISYRSARSGRSLKP